MFPDCNAFRDYRNGKNRQNVSSYWLNALYLSGVIVILFSLFPHILSSYLQFVYHTVDKKIRSGISSFTTLS